MEWNVTKETTSDSISSFIYVCVWKVASNLFSVIHGINDLVALSFFVDGANICWSKCDGYLVFPATASIRRKWWENKQTATPNGN